ncbi:MAG: hypothetical protein ISS92_02135 [Candidatus Omnitrophica bacterium]|nr:hypothetical protein [Candidatus Omnitrophota bacterium]
MKYRTVIEITADAENRDGAIDLAGEFLKGELEESGITMKWKSTPLKNRVLFHTGIFLVFAFVAIGTTSFGYLKSTPVTSGRTHGVSAFQPPLKTGRVTSFKKVWKDEENKKALDRIRK